MKTSLADKILPEDFLNKLDRLLRAHAGQRARGEKTACSTETRRARRQIIKLCFAELWQMRYRLQSPEGLGDRHIQALGALWQEKGLSKPTLHNRISHLRTFAGWIGKKRMVKDVPDYFPGLDTRRRTVADQNRAWRPNGVMPEAVISRAYELDERFGIYLELMDVLGLRMKEAIEMRPARCLTESGQVLEIYEGTKGGRPRRIDIVTDQQREVFERARAVAAKSRSGRLRWPDTTWLQARRRYYNLADKLGITKARLGVTSHGLRHGYAQEKYIDLTGELPPVMGGDPKRMDSRTHKEAGQHIARDLGHGRPAVGASYYGSHGHAMRGNAVAKPDGQGE